MGREVGQGKMKYLKISCSYVLKSTSYLGLAVNGWPRFVLSHSCSIATIENNNLMAEPASLHPVPTMQHLRPPTLPLPSTILLGTRAVVLGMQ